MSEIDIEELIRNTLKSGRKTPSELKKLCKKGLAKSTYHYHLSQLVKRKEVEHVKIDYYVLTTPRVDVEASRIIEKIDLENIDLGNCLYWIRELRHLCHRSRTGHITELLDAIKRYVNTQRIFENDETRKELAMTMSYILHNEKEVGSIKTANNVIEVLFEPVREIALSDRKEGCRYAVRFLSETGDKESVDIVMNLIRQRPSEIVGDFEKNIHYTLYGSCLGKKQKVYVKEKLAELSSSNDESVRSVAVRLQKRSRLYS